MEPSEAAIQMFDVAAGGATVDALSSEGSDAGAEDVMVADVEQGEEDGRVFAAYQECHL